MNKNIYAVIDVESIGSEDRRVYDLAVGVCSGREVYDLRQWGISEVLDDPVITNAYFANKLPYYEEARQQGTLEVVTFENALQQLNQLLDKYNVTHLTGYNFQFDISCLQNMVKLYTARQKGLHKPYTCFDLWGAATESFMQRKSYKDFAELTKKGNIKTNAENAYAYVQGLRGFRESHIALHDVIIEIAILQYIIRTKKKVTKNTIISNPWKLVNKPA